MAMFLIPSSTTGISVDWLDMPDHGESFISATSNFNNILEWWRETGDVTGKFVNSCRRWRRQLQLKILSHSTDPFVPFQHVKF